MFTIYHLDFAGPSTVGVFVHGFWQVLTPVDFGAKGDGHHDDSSAVWCGFRKFWLYLAKWQF